MKSHREIYARVSLADVKFTCLFPKPDLKLISLNESKQRRSSFQTTPQIANHLKTQTGLHSQLVSRIYSAQDKATTLNARKPEVYQ
jgi:hypothetical protein